MPIYSAQAKSKLYLGDKKVKKAYQGNVKVYSSGNIVTYMVDTGVTYQEEVDEGGSCLSPKTFAPTKSGWTFAGWREDSVASSSVLSAKVMGDEPVTLYAVFKQTVTLTLYNNSATAATQNLTRYYNNGNTVNPTYTMSQAARSGWTAKGWSTSAEANGGITHPNGALVAFDRSLTFYGRYDQSVTLTYWDGTKTVKNTYTRNYNSSGKTFNPTVALWQVAVSGWNYIGFTTSSAANGAITHQNGAIITMDGNKTFYARYNRTLTCRFDGGGATGGSTATASGVQDRGNNGSTSSVSITMPQCGYSRTSYAFAGWSCNAASNILQPGAIIKITESTFATATWTKLSWSWNQVNPGRYAITIPYTADYVISCYGARGGNYTQHGFLGGFGGWAQGTVTLTAGTVIYAYVGGAGADKFDFNGTHYNGGYNGGGASPQNRHCAPGGGATHVATVDGLLQNLSGNRGNVLIVAGGGGGAGDAKPSGNYNPQGGGGGGTNGSHGFGGEHINTDAYQGGQGGSQTAGGNSGVAGRQGVFGKGSDCQDGGAGGGGWYGGGAGGNFNGGSGGGGGSGYIGGVRGGQMKNDVQNGNGKIDIWIP